jgi:hypothetical protein
MAKRKITPEMEARKFVPGQSGNPGGKPKQLLTKDKVKGLVDRFYNMSRDDLKDVAKDPKATVIELTIASIMVKCIEAGDFSRFDGMLSRAIGKVADEIIMPKPMVIRRPSGETVELTTQAALEGDDETRDND